MAKKKKTYIHKYKKAIKTKSPKASGLSITRAKGKFTFAWKLPAKKYGRDVRCKYSTEWTTSGTGKNKKKVYKYGISHDLAADETSMSATLNTNLLYPFRYKKNGKWKYRRKVDHVCFAVHGRSAKETYDKTTKTWKKETSKEIQTHKNVTTFTDDHTYSDWVYAKSYNIVRPLKPTVDITRKGAYDSTVTITPHYNDSGTAWSTMIQYDVKLIFKKKGAKNFQKLIWPKEPGHRVKIKSAYSFNINHAKYSTSINNSDGAIVYVRARVCGPAGNGPWVVKDFSYAAPIAADSISGQVVIGSKRNTCNVSFKYYNTKSRPVTAIKVQYAFAVPTSKVYAPIDPQWEDAPIGGDGTMKPAARSAAKKKGKVSFRINQAFPSDQLLYVRVLTIHNEKETTSKVVYCKTGKKIANLTSALKQYKKPVVKLSVPDITNVELGHNINKVTVSVTNNSAISGVKLAFYIIPVPGAKSPNGTQYKTHCIGVKATNTSQTDYSFTIAYPKYYPIKKGFGIGVRAFIGTYSSTKMVGYTKYTLKTTNYSAMRQWGGTVPTPPKNITLDHLGDGNVKVTWAWDYWKCDYAEIAWSDYKDAFESTDQPTIQAVESNKVPKIIVRNLEMGKPWYFWGRTVKGEVESPWSDAVSTNLILPPKKPVLMLSKDVMSINDQATANWDFISTDGSIQDLAELYLCKTVVENNKTVTKFVDVIGRVPNDDSADPETNYFAINPKALGWSKGKIYKLAVKVGSDYGEKSDMSAVQTIRIAKAVQNRNITTSLTPQADYYNSATNPKSHSQGEYALIGFIDEPDKPTRINTYLYKALEDRPNETWKVGFQYWDVDQDKMYQELSSLPLTVTVSDSDNYASRLLKIERATDYFVERPDGDSYGGYAGEIVYSSYNGGVSSAVYSAVDSPSSDNLWDYYEYDSTTEQYSKTKDASVVSGKTYYVLTNITWTYTITQDDLIGYLDDDALYYLSYIISDEYGQTSEKRLEFRVKWEHQAIYPSANIVIEEVTYTGDDTSDVSSFIDDGDEPDEIAEDTNIVTSDSRYIAKITINNPDPESVVEGDCCDIYRFSADSIDLIYSGAQFGQTYVDPYPTIGDHGGHRIVYKTLYGDYITAENSFAWVDFKSESSDDVFYSDSNIIDFGDRNAKVKFNVDINNDWRKDFEETKYLGGSIQGDWNDTTSMTSSITASVMTSDNDTVYNLRTLARHAGICHVRTIDGMNYLANVDVSENTPHDIYFDLDGNQTKLSQYSLSITKVDPVELDGMTLAEWEAGETDTNSNRSISVLRGVSDDYYEPYEDDDIETYEEPEDEDVTDVEINPAIEDDYVTDDESEYDIIDDDYDYETIIEDEDEEDEYSDDYNFEPPEEEEDYEDEGFEDDTASSEIWDALNEDPYYLSEDTEVIFGKYYFTRSGSGTDLDPYVYELVDNPTGNPHTSNYYENEELADYEED